MNGLPEGKWSQKVDKCEVTYTYEGEKGKIATPQIFKKNQAQSLFLASSPLYSCQISENL